jgi:hypothetical protein
VRNTGCQATKTAEISTKYTEHAKHEDVTSIQQRAGAIDVWAQSVCLTVASHSGAVVCEIPLREWEVSGSSRVQTSVFHGRGATAFVCAEVLGTGRFLGGCRYFIDGRGPSELCKPRGKAWESSQSASKCSSTAVNPN